MKSLPKVRSRITTNDRVCQYAILGVFCISISCGATEAVEKPVSSSEAEAPPTKPFDKQRADELIEQIAPLAREGPYWKLDDALSEIKSVAELGYISNGLVDVVLSDSESFDLRRTILLCLNATGDARTRVSTELWKSYDPLRQLDTDLMKCAWPINRDDLLSRIRTTETLRDDFGLAATINNDARSVLTDALVDRARNELPILSDRVIDTMIQWPHPKFASVAETALRSGKLSADAHDRSLQLYLRLTRDPEDLLEYVVENRSDRGRFTAAREIALRRRHAGFRWVAQTLPKDQKSYNFTDKENNFVTETEWICRSVARTYGEVGPLVDEFLESDEWTQRVFGISCTQYFSQGKSRFGSRLKMLAKDRTPIPGIKMTVGELAERNYGRLR